METSDKYYAIAAVQSVVGLDDWVEEITDLLEMEVNDEVRIIGICGTDGIGKTTLANAVYSRITSCFDSCSFLAEVEETTQNPCGIQFLQAKLICDILERDGEDPSFDERIEDFLDIFREMKVLIVVDDVEEQSHLHAIVGDQLHWFGPGSRIIVTSKNEEILGKYHHEKAHTYMVGKLDDDQAFELFCEHAFGMQSPIPGYDGCANRIVNTTEKLPLAIEVIGSFLRGKSIGEWEKMEELIRESMRSCQKTRVGFEQMLDICYEGLDKQQKEIFLDIACFISGVDARIASHMWPSSYRPSSGCVLMPLARIGENNELQMHRLPRCLGKRILKQEESQDPGSRRFCTQDMVLKATNRETGMGNVEALCFDFRAGDFQSMPKIRFLKLDNAKLSGDFEGAFPSLRGLCWQRCPPEFDAENLVLGELAHLNLSWSKITEDWGGWKKIKMEKLEVLNLTGCSDLLFTPDFSGYKNMEMLILEGCSRLVKLDPSIGHLKRLVSLNLKFCSQLNRLPVELGGATALKELFIDGTSVREIPISVGNLKQLEILSGFQCFPLTHLPSSICYLTALSELSLHGAKITKLPISLGQLLKLRRLSLRDCRYLEELPNSISNMVLLEELDVSSTSISKFPDSIGNLKSLKVLRMDSSFIRAFPAEVGNLTNLEELHASWCLSLKGAIPSNIEGLRNLRSLTLGHSSISSLPPEISTIPGLHSLDLSQCNELEQLPRLPPSLIHLHVSSTRMKDIPLLEDLKELEELSLSDGHPKARRPPSSKQPTSESDVIVEQSFSVSFPKLRKLELSLSQVIKLKFEPTDIPPLKRLKTLTLPFPGLSRKKVSELPKMLSVFELYDSAIEEIEGLEGLEALKRLDISNCKIQNLHGIGQLTSLRSLILSDCDDLSSPDLSNLKSLKVLEIRRCKMIRQIEGLEKLTSLEKLNISECPAENSVQVQHALKHVMARSTVE
ncbi:disease resistance protein TAO1-like [Rhodamnia argentea]|uniref:Disease resistance protein TAO1-like n=1 Tax=Rhodamnia argentea TaxID=178133 RepID=A0A8B8NN95_9MYRT|nr:disease resistance protein TAO1-like [Rhodamnia argentea]